MKNKETYIILSIVLASLIILAGLFIYQRGQKIILTGSLKTKDGLKITLQEAQFRPVNDNYQDIIIKATLENTTNQTLSPFSYPERPSDPDACYRYEDNNYSTNNNPSTYNNNVNININSNTGAATDTPSSYNQPTQTAPIIPSECQEYLRKAIEYTNNMNQYDNTKQTQQFKLYIPSGSVAEADYYQFGNKKDMISYVNSDYNILQPNEKITGVFVFKVTDDTKGLYRITYKNEELTFEVK